VQVKQIVRHFYNVTEQSDQQRSYRTFLWDHYTMW